MQYSSSEAAASVQSEFVELQQQSASSSAQKTSPEPTNSEQQSQDSLACRKDFQHLLCQVEKNHAETFKNLQRRMDAVTDAMASLRTEMLRRSEAVSSEVEKPISELREAMRVLQDTRPNERRQSNPGSDGSIPLQLCAAIRSQVQESTSQQVSVFEKELQEHRSDLSKTLQLLLEAETGMEKLRAEMLARSEETQSFHRELQEHMSATTNFQERLQILEEKTCQRFEALENAVASNRPLARLADVGHGFRSLTRHSAAWTCDFAVSQTRRFAASSSSALSHCHEQGVVQTRRFTMGASIHIKRFVGLVASSFSRKLRARARQAISVSTSSIQATQGNSAGHLPHEGKTRASMSETSRSSPARKRRIQNDTDAGIFKNSVSTSVTSARSRCVVTAKVVCETEAESARVSKRRRLVIK
jgi:hypothetical protein